MWANTAPSGGLIAIGNPHPQAGARGDGQRAAAPERAPAPGRGKRQSCSCAAGGAGPRRRRSRWATSSGRTAGGAFVEAARPPTRPASPSAARTPPAPVVRAWSSRRAAGALAADEAWPRTASPRRSCRPSARWRSRRRTTGGGRRSWPPASSCGRRQRCPGPRAAAVRGRGAHDWPHPAAGRPVVLRGSQPSRAAYRAAYRAHTSGDSARAWLSLLGACALAADEGPGLGQRPLADRVAPSARWRSRRRTARCGRRNWPPASGLREAR